MDFGKRLSSLRKSKKISQEKIADKVGVTRQTIFNWESNITKPNSEDLKKITEILNVDVNFLLNNDNNHNNVSVKKKKKYLSVIIVFILSVTILLVFNFYKNYRNNINEVVGVDSVRCTFNESRYVYYISYNKKFKIVNIEKTGQIKEEDREVLWLTQLDNFVFSNEITEPNILIQQISIVHKENGGYCDWERR